MSQRYSEFPVSHSELNNALSNEPLLLNGMKILFDQSASVHPVSLQPKTFVNRTPPVLKHLAEKENQYSLPFGPPLRGRTPTAEPLKVQDGLLPSNYDTLKKAALRSGLVGTFYKLIRTTLGLQPLNEEYKRLIKDKDYAAAFNTLKQFQQRVALLPQIVGAGFVEPGKTEFLNALKESSERAESDLWSLSRVDKDAKSQIPSLEVKEDGVKKLGLGGIIIPSNLLTDDDEQQFVLDNMILLEKAEDFIERYPDYLAYLKEAWRYKKEFENDVAGYIIDYAKEEEKDDDENLNRLLEDDKKKSLEESKEILEEDKSLRKQSNDLYESLKKFIIESSEKEDGSLGSVKDIIRIQVLMRKLRNADSGDNFAEEDLSQTEYTYKNELQTMEDLWGEIFVEKKEIGDGPKTMKAKQIFKSVAGFGTLADPTGISSIVVGMGTAAKSVHSTLKHRSRLKFLNQKDKNGRNKWGLITEFIIQQKTAKAIQKGTTFTVNAIPFAATSIGIAIKLHNQRTKGDRYIYAEKLLNEFNKGDHHAGLIIIELVGYKKFRVVVSDLKQGIPILAAKMSAG